MFERNRIRQSRPLTFIIASRFCGGIEVEVTITLVRILPSMSLFPCHSNTRQMRWRIAPTWQSCCSFTRTQSAYSTSRHGVDRRRNLSHLPGISHVKLGTNLNREKGLAFEEHVVTLMQSLKCDLQATQQSRDGGIDHQVDITRGLRAARSCTS